MSGPFGPGHPAFDLFQAARDAHDKMEAVAKRGDGYCPWGAFEAIADADKFNEWFAKLPADLTDANLEPLYLLAADASQQDQLRRRERAWAPNPDNLGAKYNGPVGKDHEPLPHNLKKWRDAVEAKRLAHLNRFQADLIAMQAGDVPVSLRAAAQGLVKLALEADASQEDASEWDGCGGPSDVPAIAAALRLIESAGAEVKASAKQLAETVEESLWEELEAVDAVVKHLEGGEA